ncbi:uncharacterized protein RAG0_13611 [Rhynchosporium agropyri]|uniref:Uncharacterized protein n=1 Tax=Rhynchosporium agropyri TaxID=914238 RepID=A0A1E1LDZ1_9HELO|nr:uncharacterized protein RAG0_13611 [Rhynchosporium agropyri]
MFRLTLPACTLVILEGLARATSLLSRSPAALTKTSAQSFTSSIATFADSKFLNHNSSVRIAVTTVVVLCPIISGGVTASVHLPDQSSGPYAWSNQTFHNTSSAKTSSAPVSSSQPIDVATPSSMSPNLIFDNGPTPLLPFPTSIDSTLATSSGRRMIYGDPFLWLFLGMVSMGIR